MYSTLSDDVKNLFEFHISSVIADVAGHWGAGMLRFADNEPSASILSEPGMVWIFDLFYF